LDDMGVSKLSAKVFLKVNFNVSQKKVSQTDLKRHNSAVNDELLFKCILRAHVAQTFLFTFKFA